tara:strand:- start:856 stop:1620 length:765 start_codon:yes stop_codon:yes gene_type:complete
MQREEKIQCDNCNWNWNVKDGGEDLYVCHQCGHDNEKVKLAYGNLDKENLKYLSKKNIFTSKKDLFTKCRYPSEIKTKKEIEYLISAQDSLKRKIENTLELDFMKDADEGLEALFNKYLPQMGINLSKNYQDKLFTITDDLGALVMHLKNHFQRPRPYQVAFYTKQKLHPYETNSGHSPAFPSGHACQAHFLTLVIALHHPKYSKELKIFANKVAFSRLALGVHYPSDNAFGKDIAFKLFAMPDIQKYIQSLFR